jgi:alpha,alpha-trehalase
MKNLYWLVLIFVLSACDFQKQPQIYEPKFQKEWDQVGSMILNTWYRSKVGPATPRMEGSLHLPLPYFGIHANRNVLFCWDTYFTNAGLLLIDSLAVYAKNAVENQFAEIQQIGYVPNASEPWAHNRSQTPFLSLMVREIYETPGLADKEWLANAYEMLKKDYHFWTDTSANAIENHTTEIPGLQRFFHHASDTELLAFFKQIQPRFQFPEDLPPGEKLKIASNLMAEAETMDFTPRFEGRCPDFIPIDLNSNLYLYEKIFEWMAGELGLQNEPDWQAKAMKRQELINRYCWNADRGIFMDYDFVNQRFSTVASVATFYPLFAGLASDKQAESIAKNLSLYEYEWGVTVCEKTPQRITYQWDYPVGWPPVYYLVTFALNKYGYKKDALRIAAKYLDVATKNYMDPYPKEDSTGIEGTKNVRLYSPGYLYEKYHVVDGSLSSAEYANRPFHGWSYGVFIWLNNYYRKNSRKSL